MTAQHTPGPWKVTHIGFDHVPAIRGNGRRIAKCETALEEDEANARLIAAAPETAAERDRLRTVNAELLAALKVMTEYVEIDIEGDDNANSGTRADCRKARAAIALAEQS